MEQPVQQPPLSVHRVGSAGVLLIATAIFFWQIRHPVLRFNSASGNVVFALIAGLALPWLTAAAVFRLNRWWSKAIAIVAALPLLIFSLLFLVGMSMLGSVIENGRDLSFDKFAEVSWKGTNVRLYRTNGGATTAFGVVIRQEMPLLPGISVVREVGSFYPCRSVEASATGLGISVAARTSGCTGLPAGQQREYTLKRFVYF